MNVPSFSKCPKCDNPLSHVTGGYMEIKIPTGTDRIGIAYACPFCQVLINVEIDPIAVKTETLAEITKLVRRDR